MCLLQGMGVPAGQRKTGPVSQPLLLLRAVVQSAALTCARVFILESQELRLLSAVFICW